MKRNLKTEVDVMDIDGRLEEIKENFEALSDFILVIYDDMDVEKSHWMETCSMISILHMQLMTLNKKNFDGCRGEEPI